MKLFSVLTLISAALLVAAGSASAQARVTVVANGLDSPRGLAFGPIGDLYVAEAGHGGAGPCGVGAEAAQVCYGPTGAITRIGLGGQQRIATGLPSTAGAGPQQVGGPHDVAFRGARMFVAIGLGAAPATRAAFGPAGASLGQVVELGLEGGWRNVADLAAYEAAVNPDGGVLDSNPFSLLDLAGGLVVADAGANALIRVEEDGRIVTSTIFPRRLVAAPPFLGLPPGAQMPMDSVPDSVAVGPDGALYIGELTGFPFPVGIARIYRRAPGPPLGQIGAVWVSGFTNIIDLAFGPDGSLYVLEYATNGLLSRDPTGRLVRLAPDGTRTTVFREGLVNPTGLAVDASGAIYVSNFGLSRGGGQVLEISPSNPTRGRGR